jgi:hypothetical protein
MSHPASYPIGSGRSFPYGTTDGREADHLHPIGAEIKKNVDLHIHSAICLHGIMSLAQGQLSFSFTYFNFDLNLHFKFNLNF